METINCHPHHQLHHYCRDCHWPVFYDTNNGTVNTITAWGIRFEYKWMTPRKLGKHIKRLNTQMPPQILV